MATSIINRQQWTTVAEDDFSLSTLAFLKAAIFQNQSTGALVPSSKVLAEHITDLAGLPQAETIVEFGPGTGVFTEVILRKKRPDARFFALEVNEDFVKATRKRCPHVTVYHDSAGNVLKYLEESGLKHCDIIISGLPWTRFDDKLQDEILNATYAALRPGGRFVTFAYLFSLLVPSGRTFFREKLPEKFNYRVRSRDTWINMPPCSVFLADKV